MIEEGRGVAESVPLKEDRCREEVKKKKKKNGELVKKFIDELYLIRYF